MERGKRIVELFKQVQYQPQRVAIQVVTLWAVQEKYFDSISVDRVKEFQTKLADQLITRKADLLDKIESKGKIDDEVGAAIKAAVDEFKSTWQ